jgi:hypothetical protein
MKFEYATLEWLWDSNSLRVNFPGGDEKTSSGSYKEVVGLLTALGSEGWDVASCVAGGNWLFWTLKRTSTSGGRA